MRYDANGERIYKLTGTCNFNQLNSGSIKAQAIFDDAVLYPNPYVVITTKGYTKHYYAGTERIATVIGGGGFGDMVSPTDNLSSPHDQDIIKTFYSYYQNYDPFFYQKIVSQPEKTEDIFGKPSSDLDYHCTPTELVMVDILNPPDILLKSISINEQNNGSEKEVYFYHGDHLGSANWITDYTGAPVQYIHYAPYGELIDNQAPYGYDERYKFTGKERDAETGYDFFGARFYWQAGSWLSVDPLADKYPNISPYAYAAWNPIKYVDPDGREIINKMDPMIDKSLHDAGNNIIDKRANRIFFVSHGSSTAMFPYGQGEMNADAFVTYLSENSEVWKKTEDKSSIVIVLISCETGKGENPIAQQISKLLPEVTIVAPTEEVKAVGTDINARLDGVAQREAVTMGDVRTSECAGNWNVYRNGKLESTSEDGCPKFIYNETFKSNN